MSNNYHPLKYYRSKNHMDTHRFLTMAIVMCQKLYDLHMQDKSAHVLIHSSILVTEKAEVKFFPLTTDEEESFCYYAPEQMIQGSKTISSLTDIYVLGLIFYEALLGELPFDKSDKFAFSHKVKTQNVPFVADIDPSIPLLISSIVEKMTTIDHSKRYQDILSVSIDLTKALHLWEKNDEIEPFKIDTFRSIVDLHSNNVLYGRAEEEEKLQYIIDSKRAKENKVVLLYGDSGIGKSLLVKTVIANNRPLFSDVFQFKLVEGQQSTPYQIFYNALRDKTRQILAQDKDILEKYRNKLHNILGNNAYILSAVIPEIEMIIGKQEKVEEGASKVTLEHLLVQFIELFKTYNMPLCIYIDDIQWADKVTIEWVKNVILKLDDVMLFMTYRDVEQEVTRNPLFTAMLFELSSYDIKIEEFEILTLTAHDIDTLIGDTMQLSNSLGVAQRIYDRTKGNPFFVKEYLKLLYKDAILWFDMKHLVWKCDMEKIDRLQISDNVFDMLSKTIDSLEPNVRRLLCIASCMGNTFSYDLLQKVFHNNSLFEKTLTNAINSGWIVLETSKKTESTKESESIYRFLHDKMQETIHTFLLGKMALKVHYKIGCHLEKQRTLEDKQNLLTCVNHLNIGSLYVRDKTFLSELNMDAAVYAKHSGDFESALRYISKSMELAFLNSSVEHTVEMLKLRAECEHLCNRSDDAIVYYEKALEFSQTSLEKAQVYELLIKLYSDISEFAKAYEVGQTALKIYRINIPKKFVPPLFIADFLRLKFKLRGYSTQDLINLPISHDDDFKMTIRLLANTLQAAYQIQPELSVANALIIVRLCLKHGLTKESVIGFTVFGVIFQGAILGRHALGFDYSQFSFEMLKKFHNTTQHAEVQFVCGYFATSWKLPAVQTEENWNTAYKNGLEIGDWFHTGCAAAGIVQSMFMRGVAFEEILKQLKYFEKIVESIGASEQLGAILSVKQAILNLSGQTLKKESFDTNDFDESTYITSLNDYKSEHFAHYYFINKMIVLYVDKSYKEALNVYAQGKKFANSSKGMLHNTEYMFYAAMSKAKLYSEALLSEKSRYKRYVIKTKKKFRIWAEECSENFLVRALMLEAEHYRILKQYKNAFVSYESAIESATVYGQVHLKALANRLMAELYDVMEQPTAAKLYHHASLKAFNKWGINHSVDVQDHDEVKLDIHTLMKASEVIAREYEFSSLLQTLIGIIVENIGAQRGFLLLEKEGDFMIQASTDEVTKSIEVMQNIPYLEQKDLVHPIVNYVLRSKESIVIDDMMQSNIFDTSYVSSRMVKSVLCAPLMLQGVLKGIIYLENNVLPGVFTANKVKLLQHLSGQIIISIENTIVYNDLEEKIKQRTKDLEATKDELKLLASTDPLTKLFNRRYFANASESIFKLSKRESSKLSVLMLDVDNFKKVNDTYGHQVGDSVIVAIANILLELTRKSDVVCRYGGEEFIVLLPHTDDKDAISIAEKIRTSVENNVIDVSEDTVLHISVSIGVALVSHEDDKNIESTIRKADSALYTVKKDGKNSVLFYEYDSHK